MDEETQTPIKEEAPETTSGESSAVKNIEPEPLPPDQTASAEAEVPMAAPLPAQESFVAPLPAPVPEPVTHDSSAVRENPLRNLLAKAKEKIQFRKRQRLEKILALAGLCQSKGKKLMNDDVQKLLRVSDKTATRYLGQLVREGRLKRIGNTGQAVYYEIPS
jgi:hypothetical protein